MAYKPDTPPKPSEALTSSSSPPSPFGCLKCGLDLLFEDDTGTELFEAYLREEECDQLLNFYFAVRGLKSNETQDKDVSKMVKVIYKHFLENSNKILCLREETKNEICNKMASGQFIRSIFNHAYEEVFDYMNDYLYPNFMKESGIYLSNPKADSSEKVSQTLLDTLNTVVFGGSNDVVSNETPSTSAAFQNSSSTSTSKVGGGGPCSSNSTSSSNNKYRLTQDAIKKTESIRSKTSAEVKSKKGFAHPAYHTAYISYNPVTMQSSEVQSMSSEDMSRERARRLKMKVSGPVTIGMSNTIEPSGHLNPNPKQLEIGEFVKQLTDKLLIAQMDLEKQREDKMKEHLKLCHLQDNPQFPAKLFDALNARFCSHDETNEIEILDKHVNRIWSDKTPPTRSYHRSHNGHNHNLLRKEKETIAQHSSRDTGIDQDFGPKLPVRQMTSEGAKPIKKNKSLEWDSGISTISTAKSVPKSQPKLDDRVHHWI